ncbi:MAG: WYL domain-containing protein [Bacteroidota bacterium]
MNQPATLHRHLSLIRRVRQPYLYPSKQKLLDELTDEGFQTSKRTLERDIKAIKDLYGLVILQDHHRKGYYLNIPTDEDLADFDAFVELLERRERLAFLGSAVDGQRGVSRYLQLERNDQFIGAELLPLLWDALRSGRAIAFDYFSYTTGQTTPRLVEPKLIFEYRNRWYFDSWDVNANQLRTFGLDRVRNLRLTGQFAQKDRLAYNRSHRQHTIGVTCQPDQEPEKVVLRFSRSEAQYVQSLPLHSSQRPLKGTETAHTVDFELMVVLNHELEREILAYGEEVEVLEPTQLRQRITERAKHMARKYYNSDETIL